ncbi:MAG: hypothetical protein AAF958_05950, partial [Planctomycetota bacterium]
MLRSELLEDRRLLAFSSGILADINQVGVSSDPESLVELDGALYFIANDGTSGSELFTADPSGSGAQLVIDLFPGDSGSGIRDLTVVGDKLFFVATDDGGEEDLWTSDGSASGTVKVLDADTEEVFGIESLTASGPANDRVLFFTAYDDTNGYELWSSDGTVDGTTLVRDINEGDELGAPPPQSLTDVNGTLFFAAYDNGYYNSELWKSDGTVEGTVLVRDLNGDSEYGSLPQEFGVANNLLFFQAEIGDGFELFVSDGTFDGTKQVADLNPGDDGSYPTDFTEFNGATIFIAEINDGAGTRLFSTDGDTITPLPDPSGAVARLNPNELTVFDDRLFFTASGAAGPGPVASVAPELTSQNSFYTGGDYAGVTTLNFDEDRGFMRIDDADNRYYDLPGIPNDGSCSSNSDYQIGGACVTLERVDLFDLLIRDADAGDVPTPQWEWTISDPEGLTGVTFSGFATGHQFDGVDEGLVFELFVNGDTTTPSAVQTISGSVLNNFSGSRDSGNINLTLPDAGGITDVRVRMSFGTGDTPNDSLPSDNNDIVIVNATLRATGASSGLAGRELHVYDGTDVEMLVDLVPGGSAEPSELTPISETQMLFSAIDPINGVGRELYVTDGTAIGTELLADLRPGVDEANIPLSSNPTDLTLVGSQVFFAASGANGDRELYASDGSVSGTGLAANVNDSTADSDPQQFVVIGTDTYFVADDGVNGQAIYRATEGGTGVTQVLDVTAESVDRIQGLVVSPAGDLVFAHNLLGVFTWNPATDTLLQLTAQVPLSHTPGDDGTAEYFAFVGDRIFFSAPTSDAGIELWSSDGTVINTAAITDINPVALNSSPTELTTFGNRLAFAATGPTGRELYTFEPLLTLGGGLDGMLRLHEIRATDRSSSPTQLTVVGSLLMFVADGYVPPIDNPNSGTSDFELQSFDGDNVVTYDIRPGNEDSNPASLTAIDGRLYFTAVGDNNVGREPHVFDSGDNSVALLANVNPGSAASDAGGFIGVGDQVYFAATTGDSGRELFVNDTQTDSVVIVDEINPGNTSSDPIPLAALPDGRLFFSALTDGNLDRELFVTGGLVSGAIQVVDLNPGPSGGQPSQITRLGNRTLLVGRDDPFGVEVRDLIEVSSQVESVAIFEGEDQRSYIPELTITFDSRVQLEDDAFVLTNTTLNETVTYESEISIIDEQTVVRLTFNTGASVSAGRQLLDGEYRLLIDDSKAGSFGSPLDGDGDGTAGGDYIFGASPADDFFRKYGDENGDRSVNLLDFAGFRTDFG